MIKLLEAIDGQDNRRARFKSVTTLIKEDQGPQFVLIVYGVMTKGKRGESGFGYDPIF